MQVVSRAGRLPIGTTRVCVSPDGRATALSSMTLNRLERRPDFPPLAWLLSLHGQSVSLTCGTSVATRDDAFVEGAWAGAFDDWAFGSCCDVFGSGACQTPSGWLLVPPSHTLECIFFLRPKPRTWIASNSLAFLLARTNARFVLPSHRLSAIFVRIVNGIDESPITLETTLGTLTALYHHNCLLTPKGSEIRPKPLPPRFPDYSAYVTHLREAVSLVAFNAAAARRPQTYLLLASLSSGYDSPACTVLAREAGCEDAITFASARGGVSDDGRRIGEYLNVSAVCVDRPRDATRLGETELEFLATGMQAEDVVYAAAADHVRKRVLVTGFHGDKIWDISSTPNAVLTRGDISGSSMAEFRVARDFVHVPLPFAGAQQHGDVSRISHSEEMKSFSVDGAYNRPIPRRIVEEAGVPRELFGQEKKAISLLVFQQEKLLSSETRRGVAAHVEQFGVLESFLYSVTRIWFRLGMRCHMRVPLGNGKVPAPIERLYEVACRMLRRRFFTTPFRVFEHTDPVMGVAWEYALSRVSRRYRGGKGG